MASPNISFDNIPSSIRKPGVYTEFNTKLAVRTLPANAQSMLIIAQKTDGTDAPLAPVQVFDDITVAELCGYGSQAHRMARAAIRANAYLDLSILPVPDDSAGIAAKGALQVTGTATGAGVLTLTVGAVSVSIACATGDEAAAARTALIAALGEESALPVMASQGADDDVDKVVLTAKNKGTPGNGIALAFACTVPGLNCEVTAMSGGQQDPDITDALAAVFAASYTIYCVPWAVQTQLAALRDHLDALGGPMEQRGGIGVYAMTGTLSTAATLAEKLNSGRILGGLLPGCTDPAEEVAAALAAVIAGEEDPARPLNTLALTGISVPPMDRRLGRNEQEVCLKSGVTPLEVGPGDKVQIVRAISTYLVNAAGTSDVSLLDITTIRTLDYTRKAVNERLSLRFPREKLSSRTPARVRSEILDVLRKMEELEILEEVDANAEGVIVERDSQDVNRLNAKIPADVVNGLHVMASRIDLLL